MVDKNFTIQNSNDNNMADKYLEFTRRTLERQVDIARNVSTIVEKAVFIYPNDDSYKDGREVILGGYRTIMGKNHQYYVLSPPALAIFNKEEYKSITGVLTENAIGVYVVGPRTTN